MRFTTILMDADDTIFDFPVCEYGALKATLVQAGYEVNDEIYRNFSSINDALWKQFEIKKITRAELKIQRFRELIKRCLDGFDNAEMLAECYVTELSKQAVLIDGAYESIRSISRCCDIYVITNGISAVQHGRFDRSKVTEYIRKIYISDEIGIQKPQREFFDYVLDDIGEKDKSNILVVGDSLTSDMQGGKNAALFTCLYDPQHKVEMPHPLCDFRIDTLDSILTI